MRLSAGATATMLLAAAAVQTASAQVIAGWATAHDYSLPDQNAASPTSGIAVGPSYYPGLITMHYFGHQS